MGLFYPNEQIVVPVEQKPAANPSQGETKTEAVDASTAEGITPPATEETEEAITEEQVEENE